jgi:hypothetical protein
MAEEQYEVYPEANGDDPPTWNWRLRADDRTKSKGDGYAERGAAIAAAREANGAQVVNLTRDDGSSAGVAKLPGKLRVVLLRLDGSEYGELDGPVGTSATPQVVTLTPVEVSDTAQQVQDEDEE